MQEQLPFPARTSDQHRLMERLASARISEHDARAIMSDPEAHRQFIANLGGGRTTMSGRYKGVHHKGAPDLEDLRVLAEMVRRLQVMAAAINPQHPCQHPMAAARATVFACWAEVSGEGQAWSLPATVILSDGRARRTLRPSNSGASVGGPGVAVGTPSGSG